MQREGDAGGLARALRQAASAEAQRAALERYAIGAGEAAAKSVARREKYECRVADMKITARDGECRIKADLDFTGVPRDRLEEAIRAFDRVLKGA